MVRAGDELRIEVFKADGRLYRWWPTVVERLAPDELVTWNRPGHVVHGRDHDWTSRWGIRNVYWPERPYNLLEVYYPNGCLHELYVHVASHPTFRGLTVAWQDYELDVVLKPGREPELYDQDEFAAAAVDYGYSSDFQAACYRIAAGVAAWLPTWRPA